MRGRAFGGEGMRVGDWECQKDDDDDRALLFRPNTRLRVFVPAYFRGVWQHGTRPSILREPFATLLESSFHFRRYNPAW